MKAIWNGKVIAESDDTVMIEGNHYFPVKKNREGNVSVSFGIGLAIPDAMVNDPYFYLSVWSGSSTPGMKTLPSPEAGEWITTPVQGKPPVLMTVLKLTPLKKEPMGFMSVCLRNQCR